MDSQIDFVDSQTLTSKPEVTPGQILVSSKDLNWHGIHVEKGENNGFTPDNVTVTQHYFAMNTGPAIEWEWKDGDTFKTHRYETGDLWINPAGVPFSHRISGHNQFVLLTLEPQKLIELLPEGASLGHSAFRREHRSKDKHLQMLMQTLLLEAEMGGPNGQLYVDSLSTALSAHFVNHYSLEQPNLVATHTSERQRLRHVTDYIEAHLIKDMSLSDLALQAGLSKFHFSRLFKQTIGLTPHKYVVRRRIEHAARQLKQGQSITQVAHQLGFSDQSHFTRVFKQIKGSTPRQFIQGLL